MPHLPPLDAVPCNRPLAIFVDPDGPAGGLRIRMRHAGESFAFVLVAVEPGGLTRHVGADGRVEPLVVLASRADDRDGDGLFERYMDGPQPLRFPVDPQGRAAQLLALAIVPLGSGEGAGLPAADAAGVRLNSAPHPLPRSVAATTFDGAVDAALAREDAPTRLAHTRIEPPAANATGAGAASAASRRPTDDGDGDGEPSTLLYLAACLFPAGLLDATRRPSPDPASPLNGPGPADRALARLLAVKRRRDAGRPVPLVLTGDNVYADATAGMFDPASLDEPRRYAWRARNARPTIGMLGASGLQSVATLDDHEIENDWEPSADRQRAWAGQRQMRAGRTAFERELRRGVKFDPKRPGLWRTEVGDFHVDLDDHLLIVGDSRTERGPRSPAEPHAPRDEVQDPRRVLQGASILGDRQATAWEEALRRHAQGDTTKDKLRFIVTPAMTLPRPIDALTPRLGDPDDDAAMQARTVDGWAGYPGSLRRLLAFIARERIDNVVLLGGDAHLACQAHVTLTCGDDPRRPITLRAIHAPALYAPFPFANGKADEFPFADTFEFDPDSPVWGTKGPVRPVRVDVRATFPPIVEGFVRLALAPGPHGGNALARLIVEYEPVRALPLG